MRVDIYNLLMAGWMQKDIAKQLKITQQAVNKAIRNYERKGIIERISSYRKRPVIYKAKENNPSPVGYYNPHTTLPSLLPHKFGAGFNMNKRPMLNYERNGVYIDTQPTHTAWFGKIKCWIWLKSFRGETQEEIIRNGRKALIELADAYAHQYGIQLTFHKWNDDIEWVMTSKQDSERLNAREQIGKGVLIAGVWHKFDDDTHRGLVELNRANGYAPELPTDRAGTLELIYLNKPELKYLLEHGPKLLVDLVKANEILAARVKELERRGKG